MGEDGHLLRLKVAGGRPEELEGLRVAEGLLGAVVDTVEDGGLEPHEGKVLVSHRRVAKGVDLPAIARD